MSEKSERRESTRVPMTFRVASPNGQWLDHAGDLSINGVRLENCSPFWFMPLVNLAVQLPDELQERRVQVRIKRYFIMDGVVHASALFYGLSFENQVAIARCIDGHKGA